MGNFEAELDTNVELYDGDLAKIRELLRTLNAKYARRRNTKQNLLDLVREAEDSFRAIGFEITVAWSKPIAWAMGVEASADVPALMTFSIDARVDQEEFDHDRLAWEAKHQVIEDAAARRFLTKGGTVDQRVEVEAKLDPPEKDTD